MESVFVLLYFSFLETQISFLYHFCVWQYWEHVLYCLNLKSTGLSLKICPNNFSLWYSCDIFIVIYYSFPQYRDMAVEKLYLLCPILLPEPIENRRCRGALKNSPCCSQRSKIWIEVFGPAGADTVKFSSGRNKSPSWKKSLHEFAGRHLWGILSSVSSWEVFSSLASDLVSDPCELWEM